MCTPVTNNESPQYVDVTGDGRRDLLASFSPDPEQPDGPDRQMAYMTADEDCQKEWHIHALDMSLLDSNADQGRDNALGARMDHVLLARGKRICWLQ